VIIVKRWSAIAAILVLGLAGRTLTRAPAPKLVRVGAAAGGENAVARGRLVYESYGCALCHGPDGKGGFANPNAETAGKVPGVLFVAEGYTEGELRKRILDGVAAVGRADPKGPRPPYRMPGWAGQMSDRELGDLVQYLMSLYPKSSKTEW